MRDFGFDDPFRVASVSKMVTATGLMRLRPDLDADVSIALGERFRASRVPRDAHHLAHDPFAHERPRNGADFPVLFGRALLERLRAAAREPDYGGWFAPPTEPPGFFSYSDVNFGLVAQIIERMAQKRLDLLHDRRRSSPRSISTSATIGRACRKRKRARGVAGCRAEKGRWLPQVDAAIPRSPAVAIFRAPEAAGLSENDYALGDNGLAFSPHGGLRLSLADMDRLARLYVHEEIVPHASLQAMTAPAWTYDPAAQNGRTEDGFYRSFGLGVHTPSAEGFFGRETADWRGHFGDAYGWMTGLFWNLRDRRTIVWALNGMPETDRPRSSSSPLTAPEQTLIDLALASF